MSFNDAISESDLTTEEVKKAFKSLKCNKAAGVDTRNDEIKDILFLIFNTSFQQGTFPNTLKIAKVTLLFKSGDVRKCF